MEREEVPVTTAIADTVRQDLLVDAARRLGRDPTFDDLDDRQLVESVTTGAAEIAAATARWLAALAELVVRGVWAHDGAASPATWLSWACGVGASTAREHVRVALRLRDCPLVADRFAAGRISYSKVRAITRVCSPEIEPMLLAWADAAPAAVLERIVADARRVQRASEEPVDRDDLGLHRRWRDDGTYEVVLRVDAATGTVVDQHLDRLLELDHGDEPRAGDRTGTTSGSVAQETPAQRPSRAIRLANVVADALGAAVRAGPADTSGADRHTVVIRTTADLVLDATPVDATSVDVNPVDATPVDAAGPTDGPATVRAASAETPDDARDRRPLRAGGTLVRDGRGRTRAMSTRQLRRLACTATTRLVAVGAGTAADLGRARREPDARLRRLLHERDLTCRFPGCGATRHLHAHHVVWWSQGGPTDLDNLVLLCRHHHATVHDRGWQLRPVGRGRWSFHPPPGHADAAQGPWPVRRPTAAVSPTAVRTAAAVHAPDIAPTHLRPPAWDGLGYDHDLAVGVLVERAA